jgi:hypothetical protein
MGTNDDIVEVKNMRIFVEKRKKKIKIIAALAKKVFFIFFYFVLLIRGHTFFDNILHEIFLKKMIFIRINENL